MLPKYKLLATLYLCQRFNGSTSSPPSADIFRHLLGTSFGQTISRLHNEKLIVTSTKPGSTNFQFSILNSQLSLTYLGTNALLSHYPLLDYFQSPSSPNVILSEAKDLNSRDSSVRIPQNDGGGDVSGGKFTIVVFNIPEEKRQIRDRLRYMLKSAGFGQINRSLYLSPHLTVKEATHLLSSRPRLSELKGEAFGRLGFAFSVPFESFKEMDKGTLMSFWDLKEVEGLYEEALAVLPSIDNAQLIMDNSQKKDSNNSQLSILNSQLNSTKAGRFLSKFLDGLGKDPFLPPLLLPASTSISSSPRFGEAGLGGPNNWPGRKALEIAKEILTD